MTRLHKLVVSLAILFSNGLGGSRHSTTNAFAIPESSSPSTSLITGANGYIGRAVAHELLQQGPSDQEILCLVRPTRVESEKEYWHDEPCIKVLPYDMLDGGTTLRQAIDSCAAGRGGKSCCMYHIASVFGPTDDHVQTAHDNVQGTEDVVKILCGVPKSRLVLTSSMAAVRATGQAPSNGEYYTEKDWNTLSKLGENWGASYQWSKAESERRAWKLSTELGVFMVSLCPSFVFGPPSSLTGVSGSFSIELVGKWVKGESEVQSRLFVDVRDVAKAHVAAGRLERAIGQRYLLSTEARISSQSVASILQDMCRECKFGNPNSISYDAAFTGGSIPIGQKEVEAIKRLENDLGVRLRPAEETIADMGKFLLKYFQTKAAVGTK